VKDISDKIGRQNVANAGNFSRCLGLALLIVGIITGAMDVSFCGFKPIYWFLIAIFWFIIVVGIEVALLRLDTKKEK
jgi:hypothetical protein